MGEETKVVDTNTKTQLSLAAALFFSPLVHHMLNTHTRNITDKDKDFIRGYIKFGYITILFGVISIATGVLNYLFALNILSITYTISITLLIFLLIISIVSILSDISLMKGTTSTSVIHNVACNKKDIILKYLPIYNIYLWYTAHSFASPNRWIKESLLLRTLFWIVSMTGNVFLTSTLMILIILRISALMSDIDFLPLSIKQRLNTLFLKNPEELVGYLTGMIIYLIKVFAHIFIKLPTYSLEEEIQKEKESYSRIIDIQGNGYLIGEYLLGIILTIGIITLIPNDFTVRTYYIGFGLLIARYLTMFTQLKHLPHFPIAREILLLIRATGAYFSKHPFIRN